jgi:NAD(P)H-dependent FMN reductase
MTIIVGIAGSLRKESYNASLLRAAGELVPAGASVEIASIRGIPLYDGDVEAASGVPEAVRDLKERIARADGLLLVTPEYNGSLPGVFKNAIDWLSRPASDIPRVFGGRAVALMGATPGPFATVNAQTAWLGVLRVLGTRPWFGGRMAVPHASKAFDANGALTDDQVRAQLQKFMTGFAAFIDKNR